MAIQKNDKKILIQNRPDNVKLSAPVVNKVEKKSIGGRPKVHLEDLNVKIVLSISDRQNKLILERTRELGRANRLDYLRYCIAKDIESFYLEEEQNEQDS